MRMWLVEPKIMCQKHLCGEHVEMHMFLGTLKKRTKVNGFIENNLFEPGVLINRHDELANEMKSRGYNHKSPMNKHEDKILHTLPEHQRIHTINRQKALDDLITRCPECQSNYKRIKCGT